MSEQLVCLPDTAWCFMPALWNACNWRTELPAARKGYITFANFNNLAKVTPAMTVGDVVCASGSRLPAPPG